MSSEALGAFKQLKDSVEAKDARVVRDRGPQESVSMSYFLPGASPNQRDLSSSQQFFSQTPHTLLLW